MQFNTMGVLGMSVQHERRQYPSPRINSRRRLFHHLHQPEDDHHPVGHCCCLPVCLPLLLHLVVLDCQVRPRWLGGHIIGQAAVVQRGGAWTILSPTGTKPCWSTKCYCTTAGENQRKRSLLTLCRFYPGCLYGATTYIEAFTFAVVTHMTIGRLVILLADMHINASSRRLSNEPASICQLAAKRERPPWGWMPALCPGCVGCRSSC
jgi:hypothetical protein